MNPTSLNRTARGISYKPVPQSGLVPTHSEDLEALLCPPQGICPLDPLPRAPALESLLWAPPH